MRALITGGGGFVGRHLAAHLLESGDEVAATDRSGAQPIDGLAVHACDLLDADAVARLIVAERPQVVYHLAAQSSTQDSLSNPWPTIENNLRAQMNVLEACLRLSSHPRVLVVGSSEEYGPVRQSDLPTDEDAPLRPVTPYAVSKVGQDVMGYQYFAQHGLPTVRVRPFSHTGPGHDARFAVPSFARQVAEAEVGLREPIIRVGELNVYRDFTDVRDMVRAYRLAVVAGEPGEVYNLGLGTAVCLRDVLSDLVRMARVPLEVVVDPARVRPADVPHQQADTRRFHALTGWTPRISWHTTLRDTLDYWRAAVAAAAAAAPTRAHP